VALLPDAKMQTGMVIQAIDSLAKPTLYRLLIRPIASDEKITRVCGLVSGVFLDPVAARLNHKRHSRQLFFGICPHHFKLGVDGILH